MRSTGPTRLVSPMRPRRCCTLGTEFGHFFLLDQDDEVTLIDASISGCSDTLEPGFSVFDHRPPNPGLPIRQA